MSQSELSRASTSCPSAFSAPHLHLCNPQSRSLSILALLHSLCPLSTPPALSVPLSFHPSPHTRMPFPLRGRLGSVTHHGARGRASPVLLLSPLTTRPSGLVLTELAPLRDDDARKKKK
ncbi:hypothetical protein PBY51_017274 [Eleginops maclovinus]|uniref:Uncharacterized protein n=1 Tax=Eleginops maclovinus TaxID=56733 RepID=A0AAN7XGS6_ELEMC|nr:hypothetical protein PBY51_017274 [Eleginops maclovinus]